MQGDGPPAPQVGDAWGALAGLPPVARLVSSAQPSIDFALSKYLEAHDSLVAAPSYNKCGPPAVGRAHGPSAVGRAHLPPAVGYRILSGGCTAGHQSQAGRGL